MTDVTERRERVPNAFYFLTYNPDGSALLRGDGVRIVVPPNFKITDPGDIAAGVPRYDYYLEDERGEVQLRLRREPFAPAGDGKLFFEYVEKYAKDAAGDAAVNAWPLAWLGPSQLERSGADAGIEGCYPFSRPRRASDRFEGEYFVFLRRGYGNVILCSVVFKNFDRDEALKVGREVAAAFDFS